MNWYYRGALHGPNHSTQNTLDRQHNPCTQEGVRPHVCQISPLSTIIKTIMKRLTLLLTCLMIFTAACSGVTDTAAQPTATELPPTATLLPPTATTVPTVTLVPPTETLVPLPPMATLAPPPTLTPTPQPCNRAELVDLGYYQAPSKPGEPIEPNTEFTLVLRVSNTGACTWTTEYQLVLVDDRGLLTAASQPLPMPAVPGQTIDIPITITTPDEAGNYGASWQLRSAEGIVFGHGADQRGKFTLLVEVGIPGGLGYDFYALRCLAAWTSNRATFLPCTGENDFELGLVKPELTPDTEDQDLGNLEALNIRPDKSAAGFVQGVFPSYAVGANDYFVAIIGCMDNVNDCKVNFELRYQILNGAETTIKNWTQKADGEVQFVDVSLSGLVGQTVNFILYVEHGGGARLHANAFWGIPRIISGSDNVDALAELHGLERVTSGSNYVPKPDDSSCNKAHMMHPIYLDVPVANGDSVHPGTTFSAAWRLANVGTCTWTSGYQIVLTSGGGAIQATSAQAFPGTAAPGDTLDVAFELTAPDKPGTYTLTWQLRGPGTGYFGHGASGDQDFTLTFDVLDLPSKWRFDFIAAQCQSQWHTRQASFLPCDEEGSEKLGWVQFIEKADLEGSSADNQGVLNVRPDQGKTGYIQGIFPAFTVRQKDKFIARIGCMDGNPGCSIQFELRMIKPNGEVAIIGDWLEKSDDNIRFISVDLSKWAGKKVQFILYVRNANGRNADANGFWLNPHIENSNTP